MFSKRIPRRELSINVGSLTKGDGSLKDVLRGYELVMVPLSLNNLNEKI